MFGANNSRAAAPELLEVGGDTVVLLGRANVDDFDAASLASRGSLDEIVREYLGEYQKVRALGGLYLLSYHSQLLARPELVPALARIARRIRADTAVWLTTASEVVDWWRARAAVTISRHAPGCTHAARRWFTTRAPTPCADSSRASRSATGSGRPAAREC